MAATATRTRKTSKTSPTPSIVSFATAAPVGASDAPVDVKRSVEQLMPTAAAEIVRQANAAGQTGVDVEQAITDLNAHVVRSVAVALESLADALRAKAAEITAADLACWGKASASGAKTGEVRVLANVQPPRVDGVWTSANVSVTVDGVLGRALAINAPLKPGAKKDDAGK